MTFIQARRHGGNANAPVARVVIHATCPDIGYPGASKAGQAKANATYFATTSRDASAHYVVDVASTIQCLSEQTIGYHAPPNSHSIGVEICADGGSKTSFSSPSHAYARNQWLSPQVWPAVERAATLTRDICTRHHIPLRRLTTAQVRAGEKGICGHDNVSDAFHQSDHDDPGPTFPWDRFMAAVQGQSSGGLTMADVNTILEKIAAADKRLHYDIGVVQKENSKLKAQLEAARKQLHYDIGVVQTANGKLKAQIEDLTWVKNPATEKKWRLKDALWSIWYYVLECRNRISTLENQLSDLEKKAKS